MPEKILGIDIGSRNLKVVQIVRGFRSVEVTGHARAPLAADAGPLEVARTLKDLLSTHGLESDRYVMAVGTQEAFLRRLSFPFSSERKIEQVIRFELEPSLPLSLDEVVVDFVKTDKRPDGTQGVLAGAVPRQILDPLIGALQEVDLIPDVLELDGNILNLIANRFQEAMPERTVLLDIGESKTNLVFRQRGGAFFLRALMFGSGRLTAAVAEALAISREQASKHLFPEESDGSSEEAEAGYGALGTEVELLAREVEISLLAAQSPEQEEMAEAVILTGGGSLVSGLAPALEKALGIPVRGLGELDNLGLLGRFEDPSKDAALFAVAAGLALRGTSRSGGFNFHPQGPGSGDRFAQWRWHAGYALAVGALVAMSWLGSVGVDIYVKKQRLARAERNIETVFHRALPDFKGSLQPAQYGSILKARIDKLSQTVSLDGAEGEPHLAVDLLRAVSQAIPDTLEVTIVMLTLDGQRVRVNGKATTFNTVDSIKNRLSASDYFSTVTIMGAKAAKDGKGVQFGLELLL